MLKNGLSSGTDIVSIQYTHPITNLSALSHYRLVYESPSVTAKDEYAQMHAVKIFERVPGYTVQGTGSVELPLTTNQGRKFVYQQESQNGSFTLPYSTGMNGGVRATGPYVNTVTGETFNVTEEQVLHNK
jgi:dolichyl-diphosphooligosaccharide--protein glycosyltransferase